MRFKKLKQLVMRSTDTKTMNDGTKVLCSFLAIFIVIVFSFLCFSSTKYVAISEEGVIERQIDQVAAYVQGKSFWTNQLQKISEQIDGEKSSIQYEAECATKEREEDEKRNYCDEETCGYGDRDDEYDDGHFCATQYCQVSDPEIQEKIYQLINADREKERIKDLAKNRKEHLDEIAILNNLYLIAEKRSK